MTETIAFLITLLLVIVGLLAFFNWLLNLDRNRAEMTDEEWENRERGPSVMGSSVMAFDELIRPDMKKALEYRMDVEHGRAANQQNQGEGDGTSTSRPASGS
jgi:hypothetical protein